MNIFLKTWILTNLMLSPFLLHATNVNFTQVSTLGNSGITQGDGIAVNKNGDVFISGGPSGTLHKLSKDGKSQQIASGFKSLNGSDFDSKGNLYISAYSNNQIIRFTEDGKHSVFADNLDGPAGLVIDENDNIFVSLYGANFSGTGATILKFNANGEQSIVAENQGLKDVIGIAVDENGVIYAGNYNDRKLFSIKDEVVTFIARADVNVNQIDYFDGFLYVAGESFINSVSLDGKVEQFAGSYELKQIDGNIEEARFLNPNCVAFSYDNSIMYVYDKYTGNVRTIFKK